MQNFVLNRLSSQSSTFSYDAHVYYLPKLMQKSTSKNLLNILLIRSNFSPQPKAEIKNCFFSENELRHCILDNFYHNLKFTKVSRN